MCIKCDEELTESIAEEIKNDLLKRFIQLRKNKIEYKGISVEIKIHKTIEDQESFIKYKNKN